MHKEGKKRQKNTLLLAGTKITGQNSRKLDLITLLVLFPKAQVISNQSRPNSLCILKHTPHTPDLMGEDLCSWAAHPLGLESSVSAGGECVFFPCGSGWVRVWLRGKGQLDLRSQCKLR